jgi:hypothetical protein
MSTETYVVTGTGADAKNTIVKDPNAVLDYTFDWSEWLDAITDTIASKTIVAETGITNDSSSISGKTVIAWLSGGTAGVTYRVTCRIVTAGARTDDRSIFIKVKER